MYYTVIMKIQKDFSIKDFNTFSVDIKTKYFAEVNTIDDLQKVIKNYPDEKIFVLGGGSNVLFLRDWDGLIIKVNIMGIKVLREDEESVYVEVASGEIWDDFISWCIERNYAGVENMVMIPGTVGGAVTQNIAAYGQNITDVLFEIEVFDVEKRDLLKLKPEECNFEYRSSRFKNEWKNRYIVTSAIFKMKKNAKTFELSYHERAGRYGSIFEELKSFAKEPYTLSDVATAVKRQREKRLPNVDDYGTCGSFFRNPIVSVKKFKELEKKITDLQSYPVENLNYKNEEGEKGEFVKIPAGRLLDELGWKGKWCENVGVFDRHALCVVTNKKATGEEVSQFIQEMKKDVKKNYGVDLIEEVDIVC